ncbi:MAG: 16S rRNA (adenine(1518)-N(6)/adenine(1519)-N(6))-dimethyltransferase RsmA [Candidatus Nezhaarchaeota archaeon]|nr:16S rRNA (adenine(1518)-N(6)/adenine(1519)-N(6))-dimethyltransferase RsmA [Candidatus Nezhaarchaeota archaeon]
MRERTLTLIRKYSIVPKKEMGQSFLVNERIAKRIVELSEVNGLVVLEIGAGLGALTEILASKARLVYAVEVDPLLVKVLREEILRDYDNVILIEADFLEMTPPAVDVVVSNVPYSIATPLLFKLARECFFTKAILTLQKELALRITSKPGSKNYGRLTVSLDAFFSSNLLMIVKKEHFYPQPEVDSAVVKLERRKPPYEVKDLNLHLELVRSLFTQRNKVLRKALRMAITKLLPFQIDGRVYGDWRLEKYMNLRVKDLSPSDFAYIANVVKEYVVS